VNFFYIRESMPHADCRTRLRRSSVGQVVTPTFYIIKLCQARSALVYIFGKFSQRKIFSQFNWPKIAFMTWHIALSKNP
jgi:hypothetical protein